MDVNIKSREGEILYGSASSDGSLTFLYGSVMGRLLLKIFVRRFTSRLAAVYMNSRFSKWLITKTVKEADIDLTEFERQEFDSYNDFFTRKIKEGKRPIAKDTESFISPCDAKLSAYRVSQNSCFYIKGSAYSVCDLLGGNKELADGYTGGYCLIFRLTVDDYHRYCYIDDGEKTSNTFIPGVLHTVKPIALGRYNFYKRNCREYTVLRTKNFGEVTQVEVGAMMVGRISNLHGVHSFRRGQEKGMFEFGGSTIVLLVKESTVCIDGDIMANSADNIETVVRMGERIATKI